MVPPHAAVESQISSDRQESHRGQDLNGGRALEGVWDKSAVDKLQSRKPYHDNHCPRSCEAPLPTLTKSKG
jgi:hypothetical protein